MRRLPSSNKGDKASPRVTLRIHHLKSRDEKRSAKAAAAELAAYDNRVHLGLSMDSKGHQGPDELDGLKGGKEATAAGADAEKPGSDGSARTPRTSPLRDPDQAGAKRTFSESNETETGGTDLGDDDSKRKKRKDSLDAGKENTRNGSNRFSNRQPSGSTPADKHTNSPSTNNGKQNNTGINKNGAGTLATSTPTSTSSPSTKVSTGYVQTNQDRKSPTGQAGSPKVSTGNSSKGSPPPDADANLDDDRKEWAGGPKVPPLKIVIPQPSSVMEPETRNKSGNAARHPYVLAPSEDKDGTTLGSPNETNGANTSIASPGPNKSDNTEDNRHQRVLRSSHRSGGSGSGGNSAASSPAAPDRGSNNASPSQRQSPTPATTEDNLSSKMNETSNDPSQPSTSTTATTSGSHVNANSVTSPSQDEKIDQESGSRDACTPSPSTVPASSSSNTPSVPVELHPRKRKMKQKLETQNSASNSNNGGNGGNGQTDSTDPAPPAVHPHELPITNCYQLFLNIRKQIDRRRKGLFPVQPKPPQGFKDYLMNRCTYVLAGNATSRMSVPVVTPPSTLAPQMKELFTEQEKDRYRLRMQHVIEKEKLVLSVEQEILRVHGRAARALANQSLPFSVCTILKDEEVYNVITPEQEEKDRNARSRYNGRLFLSWLQDVDDKWEKIKESMLIRHHNEAESLHAVQRMDWEWKLKELSLCEFKAKPFIDDLHVPMVHVSDDFDLLPA